MKGEFEIPAAKRQRLETGLATSKGPGSRLFAPFRTIGLVSPTQVPFTSVPLGKTTFQITTSVGRSLQTYDLRRGLNLVFISSPLCPHTITATCAYRDRVLVAWGHENAQRGSGVWVFRRGRLVAQLEQPQSPDRAIHKVLVLGNWIVGCGRKTVEVWKNDSYEHYTSISSTNSTSQHADFTALCTLPTFVNKIFVGKSDGQLDIYNVSTGKLVHTITSDSSTSGSVTCLSAAPAVGLLAVAHADGTLKIIDAETEEAVTRFVQSDRSKATTSIAFRTDGQGAGDDGRDDGIMATASNQSGDITLWDLNRGGKITGVLRGAHETSSSTIASGISGIEFLSGQPVLVSSGLDNALKSWVFDQVPFSPIPRILHSRSGHASSITNLKFLPAATDGSEASGKWLLSAGNDRSLWGFSLRRDGQSTELSQGNIKHKAKKVGKMIIDEANVEDFKCPPITGVACSLNRDGGMGGVNGPVWTNPSFTNAEESNMIGWESVVTSHQNDKYARTWFWGRKKAGRWAFETGDHEAVTSVAVTACGTFALVGSAKGSLDMFNLQSGVHRQRFPPRLKAGQAKQLRIGQMNSNQLAKIHKGHSDAITGIIVDNLNQTAVSTSLDGYIIFWQFITGQAQERIKLDGAPISVRYNSVSGLMSVACDDLCVRIIDIETRRVVRELWGCVGQIYDHCFSHDGRWVITASMDSVLRVFDLATGHLIDAFKTETCTNVAFSSTGEFLATAHAGNIGINIWNNKSLFSHISSRQINEEEEVIDLTNAAEFEVTSQLATMDDTNTEEDVTAQLGSNHSIDQLDASLLTLSLLPQSRWQTLLHLETIRQRNKAIQPPQKPKATPFFLGSALSDGAATTDVPATQPIAQDTASEVAGSRISRLSSLQPVKSLISTHLETFTATSHSDDLVAYLSGLSPSAADLDIRSLSMQEMAVFVRALIAHLKQRRDFELVNTWMAVLLKLHGEFVSGIDELRIAVAEFQKAMQSEEARLSQSVGWARGVIEFLRSSR
ncbi:rRNA-processing protein utp21 [Lithohypha guttulata]|uniref:rRNA-processing protein utp21 n=1 Tax=Lithohypha guttulata TaxID=1690604 RepID=A0AAN7SV87_9EURO|nr:rRNA-processing protein utp21 [Lithohypha guttulata]